MGTAYLLTHFVVNRLQRRFLFVSGLEYVLLGVLLGPAVVNTMAVFDNLGRLAPVIAFAAGWIALLYGMEFKLRNLLDEARGLALRLAVVDVVGTGAAVGLGGYAFFRSGLVMPVVSEAEAACAASMLACAAAAGSSSAVDLIREAYPDLPSRLLPTLRQAARFGDMLALLGLGLVFCVFDQAPGHATAFAPNPASWAWATLGVGVGLGAVFALFLGNEANDNSRFLALVGITVFAAGASFFLEISALTVNMLLGAVLVNSKDGPAVAETLDSSLKPVTLVLMVFAGAMWVPVPALAAVVVVAGYIATRGASKATSLLLASLGTPLRRDVFRGLMAQGNVSVAIAVTFRLVYQGPAADLAYTAVLVSVMIHQLLSPRMVKRLLIDAGELDSDARFTRAGAA
ncbi:MAG: hypothetical protein H6736_05305 [Alphaproteobacteria bacterium]|nr:hypothetical protein [Alphaproteobacteria bacterium]MCB9691215.1 hypothetical protein [Alphaproteobacteria bacterium]